MTDPTEPFVDRYRRHQGADCADHYAAALDAAASQARLSLLRAGVSSDIAAAVEADIRDMPIPVSDDGSPLPPRRPWSLGLVAALVAGMVLAAAVAGGWVRP